MIQGKETKEKRQHSTTYIPYSCYECHIPEYYNNVPMHWHREFEINCILQGKGEFICGDDKFVAEEGDLLVMPPNMLHAAYPYQDNPLIYTALVFHPAMLGAMTAVPQNVSVPLSTETLRSICLFPGEEIIMMN